MNFGKRRNLTMRFSPSSHSIFAGAISLRHELSSWRNTLTKSAFNHRTAWTVQQPHFQVSRVHKRLKEEGKDFETKRKELESSRPYKLTLRLVGYATISLQRVTDCEKSSPYNYFIDSSVLAVVVESVTVLWAVVFCWSLPPILGPENAISWSHQALRERCTHTKRISSALDSKLGWHAPPKRD